MHDDKSDGAVSPRCPPAPPPVLVAQRLRYKRAMDVDAPPSWAHLEAVWNLADGAMSLVGRDHRVIRANEAMVRRAWNTYGITLKPGVDAWQGLPTAIVAQWKPCVERALAGESVRLIHEGQRLAGRSFETLSCPIWGEDPEPVAAALVLREVSSERKVAEALQTSETRLRGLLTALPDVVLRFDRELRCQEIHEAGGVQLLLPAEQVIGKRLSEVLPAQAPLFESFLREAFEVDGVHVHQYSVVQGGQSRAFESRVFRVAADEVVVVLRDTTDIQIAQARLAVAERMASMGQLAASVAHEINNPLSFLVANLAMVSRRHLPRLARELPAGRLDDLEGLVTGMADGAERIRLIVRDLMTFSRPDTATQTPLRVSEVMDATLKVAALQTRHRARIVRDYAEVPTVLGNEARLGQVFLNLLVNAAHAIPEGAVSANAITVRIRRGETDRVIVEVSDTGSGMSPETMARMFDPFFSTKAYGSGSGLGLAVCHGIVASMGGRITATSQLGQGTTVRVDLPVGEATSAAVASSLPPSAVVPSRAGMAGPQELSVPPLPLGLRILVVDDEPRVLEAMRGLLVGHQVSCAASGEAALLHLQSGAPVDAILCDVMMPDLTGVALFQRVKAANPFLADRMVFMTGAVASEPIRAFFDAVPNPRLDKPFTTEAVMAALAAVMGRGGREGSAPATGARRGA